MRVCLYARVSKAIEQNPENQFEPLLNWLSRSGHVQVKDADHVTGIFVDEISSRKTRPKKEEVLRQIRLGLADGVAVVALDRWGRTLSELVLELEEFSRKGKSLISLKEALDLGSAAGRAYAGMIAVFADFERDRNRERTMAGLATARALGKRLGRPVKSGVVLSCGHSKTRLRGGKCRSCGRGESLPSKPVVSSEGDVQSGEANASPEVK